MLKFFFFMETKLKNFYTLENLLDGKNFNLEKNKLK